MFSLQLLWFYRQPPPTLFASLSRQLLPASDNAIFNKDRRLIITNPSSSSSSSSCSIVHAVNEDSSQQYEIDPEKAREALKKLDQEIQSLPNKPISSRKVRVSDVKLTKDQTDVDTEQKLEISDSFLANIAAGLVLFTIFYNVLFYSVIKPSIDGS